MARKIGWAIVLLLCFAAVSTYINSKNAAETTHVSTQHKKKDLRKIIAKGENDYWEASLAASEDPSLYTFSLISKQPHDIQDALSFSLSQSVQYFAQYTIDAAPFPSRLSFTVKTESVQKEKGQPIIVKVNGKHTSQYFQMPLMKQ